MRDTCLVYRRRRLPKAGRWALLTPRMTNIRAQGAATLVLLATHLGPLASGGAAQAAGTLIGRVTDEAGMAVSDARITSSSDTTIQVSSDSAGKFQIITIVPGPFTLRVRHLGFAPQDFSTTVLAGQKKRVALELPRLPHEISAVEVNAVAEKPASYANTRKYDQFFARRARGTGAFLTRDQIQLRHAGNIAELLEAIPGVMIRQVGTQWKIQFRRCGSSSLPGTNSLPPPAVFIDGILAHNGEERLDTINPEDVEAIEVYRGVSELPVEARGQGCSAVFVWLIEGK